MTFRLGHHAFALAVTLLAAPGSEAQLSQYVNSVILAQDIGQTFLGKASTNRFSNDSIINTFGPYGSSFSPHSIRNTFSLYGSLFSAYSAYNSFASRPPILYTIVAGRYVAQAYLTKNTLLSPRVDPDYLLAYLLTLVDATPPSNAILLEGTYEYNKVGNSIAFGVERITNYRPLGSISGTLAISLWATDAVYTGNGTLVGYKLVESALGTLQGGFHFSNVARSGTMALVPNGNYNLVFVLSEWSGSEYLIVDWGNFNERIDLGTVSVAPVITGQPANRTAAVGSSVTLSVTASGSGYLGYQWLKDGTEIFGANASTYTLSAVQASDAGTYSVIVSNSAGSTTSLGATLTVSTPAVAPSIKTQPVGLALTAGQTCTFSVSADGTSPLSYEWRKNGVTIPGATNATLSLAAVSASDAGAYSVRITNSAGSVTSSEAALSVTEPLASRIANVSIRTTLNARQLLIVGLTMAGGEKPVLMRAVGPGLAPFGVTNAMADPALSLYDGPTHVGSNDNWGGVTEISNAAAAVGAFALEPASKDAVLFRAFSGGRTLHVQGAEAGNVIVEAYDAGSGHSARLINVSARNYAGSGGDCLIAGFSILGNAPKRVLIRAVGPTLGSFGVPATLSDPKLEVYASTNRIAENDTWAPSLAPTFASVGAFPLTDGSREAAIELSLNPGGYTVHVSPASGSGGEALVEVYELP